MPEQLHSSVQQAAANMALGDLGEGLEAPVQLLYLLTLLGFLVVGAYLVVRQVCASSWQCRSHACTACGIVALTVAGMRVIAVLALHAVHENTNPTDAELGEACPQSGSYA